MIYILFNQYLFDVSISMDFIIGISYSFDVIFYAIYLSKCHI